MLLEDEYELPNEEGSWVEAGNPKHPYAIYLTGEYVKFLGTGNCLIRGRWKKVELPTFEAVSDESPPRRIYAGHESHGGIVITCWWVKSTERCWKSTPRGKYKRHSRDLKLCNNKYQDPDAQKWLEPSI